MLSLYVQAPFAVFRSFTAGSFRPTAGFMTPTAAYGLLLNLGGIESRRDDGKSVMTLTDFEELKKWSCQIALGAMPLCDVNADSVLALPRVHTIFQQLHNYPVGTSGKDHAPATKGNKYNITPVRREFLSNLRAVVAMKGNAQLERRVRDGILGAFNAGRYGLPFLGDNSFMPDIIKLLREPPRARWFRPVSEPAEDGPIEGTTRLSRWIDRADMSKSCSDLYAPTVENIELTSEDSAWTRMEVLPQG